MSRGIDGGLGGGKGGCRSVLRAPCLRPCASVAVTVAARLGAARIGRVGGVARIARVHIHIHHDGDVGLRRFVGDALGHRHAGRGRAVGAAGADKAAAGHRRAAVAAPGLHLHRHPAAGIMVHAGGVAAAGIFIGHVVAHGAVFVHRLVGAAAHGLVGRRAAVHAFHLVADQAAGHRADDRGGAPVGAVVLAVAAIVTACAQGIAGHAAHQRADHGAGARRLLAAVDGFIAADLLRYAHLLHHGDGLQHAATFLGVGSAAGQACRGGQRAPSQPMCDPHGMLLVQSVCHGAPETGCLGSLQRRASAPC